MPGDRRKIQGENRWPEMKQMNASRNCKVIQRDQTASQRIKQSMMSRGMPGDSRP